MADNICAPDAEFNAWPANFVAYVNSIKNWTQRRP